ncbi:hypothetical protein H5T52_08025 [Candidatus Bipolaricaulota bacterium]|nr:hypothetical protein [Candidatus Bipolaricaulota bacterium]
MFYKALGGLLLVGVVAWGAGLEVNSGAHLSFATLSDLSRFISLVNSTIGFVEQPPVEGDVPHLPDMRSGMGASLGECLGEGLKWGLRAELAGWGTGTEGTWTRDGSSFDVSLSLEVGFVALEAQLVLEVVPGLFSLGLSGGWGWGKLDYACSFELPTDWEIPFEPPAGSGVYQASGPVGRAYARVKLPVFSPLHFGFEFGMRMVGLGTPVAEGVPLDLDGDGRGEGLDLSGFWLGLSLGLDLEL